MSHTCIALFFVTCIAICMDKILREQNSLTDEVTVVKSWMMDGGQVIDGGKVVDRYRWWVDYGCFVAVLDHSSMFRSFCY